MSWAEQTTNDTAQHSQPRVRHRHLLYSVPRTAPRTPCLALRGTRPPTREQGLGATAGRRGLTRHTHSYLTPKNPKHGTTGNRPYVYMYVPYVCTYVCVNVNVLFGGTSTHAYTRARARGATPELQLVADDVTWDSRPTCTHNRAHSTLYNHSSLHMVKWGRACRVAVLSSGRVPLTLGKLPDERRFF